MSIRKDKDPDARLPLQERRHRSADVWVSEVERRAVALGWANLDHINVWDMATPILIRVTAAGAGTFHYLRMEDGAYITRDEAVAYVATYKEKRP